ncbi:MAG: hypothetical protein JKY52_11670 [Flavobacteriales bacterium]|nr:hypothetical protein [Flavobacteriales bacterium]
MDKASDNLSPNEAITDRLTVSQNEHNLKVGIKAPAFSLGNNFLTACIVIGVLASCAFIYLLFKLHLRVNIMVPGFLIVASCLGFALSKLWLWHHFGEELISIHGNRFAMHRNYGLFKGGFSQRTLDCDSELYLNKSDQWSWLEFRGKGILRLVTTDADYTDFGLQLNDEEYGVTVRVISAELDKIKNWPEETQLSRSEENPTAPVVEPQADLSVNLPDAPGGQASLEPALETVAQPTAKSNPEPVIIDIAQVRNDAPKEIQPPNLETQTEGFHKLVLTKYLEKAAGEEPAPQFTKSKGAKRKQA